MPWDITEVAGRPIHYGDGTRTANYRRQMTQYIHRVYRSPEMASEGYLSTRYFEYVVVQHEAPRICFGSALEKEVLPRSGPNLSPFMRRLLNQDFPNIGPGTHVDGRDAFYDVTHRKYGKFGLGPRAPRFIVKHEYQPPWREPPKPQPWPQNCAPFNSTSKRKSIVKSNDNPAPCDTSPVYKKRQIKFAYSFQGKKSLICPVMMKCVPYNLDQCGACGCSCSAEGDYWAFENRLFLCRKHYNKFFKHCLAKFQGAKLADFKPIRDCFFAHAHNSCKAAVKIMSKEDITKKLRTEAYLDLFFPLRRFCES